MTKRAGLCAIVAGCAFALGGRRRRAGYGARRLRPQRHRAGAAAAHRGDLRLQRRDAWPPSASTDRIVGIEAFTRYPPEVLGKPLVGGRLGFSVDEVVAQRPDLVVVTPSRQAANQLIDPMERLGIPIVVLLQRNVAEILSNIRLLGRLAGVAERGEEVAAKLQARLDKVEQRVAGLKPPSVVMITGRLGNGLLLVARPGTYTGDAIVLRRRPLRASTAASSRRSRPRRSSTAIPTCCCSPAARRDMKDLIGRPGWSDMRAVKTRRVHAVSRVELLIPGPRTIDGIERLAAIFHPATPSQ